MESREPRPLAEKPPRLARVLRRWVRVLLRTFFRELEVGGLEHVPHDRGAVVVSWHPNGLVDPALLFAVLPRPITFGARHGLFRVPLLGSILRALDTVPIYRAMDMRSADDEQRRAANRASLDALAQRVADGSLAALFPEGVSHDEPHLMELKTGAARLYFRARELRSAQREAPVILPVGLHYDQKRVFRSRALVWFHAPLELPAGLDRDPAPEEPVDAARTRARELTNEIESALRDVVHATEDWRTHDLLHRARKLIRAEQAARAGAAPGKPGVAERAVGFARIRAAYYGLREQHARRVAALGARIERYDEQLRALGLEDHDLDRGPSLGAPWPVLSLLLQIAVVFLFLPPLLLFGYLVNLPAALLVLAYARAQARLGKDVATLKILAGAVAYPLTWLGIGFVVGWAHAEGQILFPELPGTPALAGLTAALLAIFGAWLTVRYVRVGRQTWQAIRVRLTRARSRASLERLRAERAWLHDAMVAMAGAVGLPEGIPQDH